MRTSIRRIRVAWLAVVPLAALAGCGRGENVTDQSIAQARRRWEKAGVRDYTLEWMVSGRRSAHYRVSVRGGEVRTIDQILPDGRTVPAHPGEPRYYGVDGLFLTIADEYAQLRTATPFGQAKGTKVVLRFDPDPKFGYPRSYRRDVLGTPMAVAIDVIRFDPAPARAAPAPAS